MIPGNAALHQSSCDGGATASALVISDWLATLASSCRQTSQPSQPPLSRTCLCVAASMAGTLMEPIYTGTPAKVYPFELDPFQKTSVACLVRGLLAAAVGVGVNQLAERVLMPANGQLQC